ncbi:PREDICTED: uncharacterized protein C8orf34-like, partial [Tauraco erythrolophus]|uniref:uncharacterized protein C8orf34-like n=1 Tax=Tauraco erythrolophus TaxID=121530 RepID=UPI00052369F9
SQSSLCCSRAGPDWPDKPRQSQQNKRCPAGALRAGRFGALQAALPPQPFLGARKNHSSSVESASLSAALQGQGVQQQLDSINARHRRWFPVDVGFELMTKLITETPDQPIPFLIDHLQSKQGNRGQLQRTLSGSAALWAESETSENKGTRRDFRSYDKPWQVNAKKPKKSKSDLAVSNISPPSPESKSLPRSIEHPKWDWRTKPENHDFDELNHILQESKKLGKALENLSR